MKIEKKKCLMFIPTIVIATSRIAGSVRLQIPEQVKSCYCKNRFDLHSIFFDITPGIEHPRVFMPPSNCLRIKSK